MVGEHAGRLVPVAGRLQVADGVGGLAAGAKPARGELVQFRDVPGHRTAQFQPEQAAEHAVVAEPGTAGVEGHDERVGVLQVQQDPLRARGPGKQVGQLAVDPVQNRGAQQQSLDFRRLPLQHLGHQVLSHRAVAARELGDEPFGVGVPGHGQDGEAQPRRPALGPLMQHRGHVLGQRDSGSGEELAGLVAR